MTQVTQMTPAQARSRQANFLPDFAAYQRIPKCEAIHILPENIYLVADMLNKMGLSVSVNHPNQSVLATLTIKDGEMTTAVQANDVLVRDDFGFHSADQDDFYRTWRKTG